MFKPQLSSFYCLLDSCVQHVTLWRWLFFFSDYCINTEDHLLQWPDQYRTVFKHQELFPGRFTTSICLKCQLRNSLCCEIRLAQTDGSWVNTDSESTPHLLPPHARPNVKHAQFAMHQSHHRSSEDACGMSTGNYLHRYGGIHRH